ncbi:DUF1934 domain-containing protein [Streptococcus gordonii]|uniref:DUF1934 domain-containing protein n=1 Tax=Streptococcus gordonii TaxID=1302 RepID=UPI0007795AB5|nr:DUF1934 domain-containing protein [Streptococcus gordonii]
MKIRMKNKIQLDGQTELIDQMYDAEWTQKGAYHYLLFKNEEDEKVVLKFHDTELNMTRFSNPKTLMRFIKDDRTLVGVPTPMGMQTLMTDTRRYYLDLEKQIIFLDYQLKTPDGERLFATYRMEISWS